MRVVDVFVHKIITFLKDLNYFSYSLAYTQFHKLCSVKYATQH